MRQSSSRFRLVARRAAIGGLTGLLSYMATFAFVMMISESIQHNRMDVFASGSIPVVGLVGFTAALLFNRARALPRGPTTSRSLYAAERATQAFFLGASGIAISYVLQQFISALGRLPGGTEGFVWVFHLLYFFPSLLCTFSVIALSYCIKSIAKTVFALASARTIAKRTRNAP